MPNQLENEFHEAMLDIYRRVKSEAGYNARGFLQMVENYGGLKAAKMVINSKTEPNGFIALREKGRLDLTTEAMILETKKYHPLFTPSEIKVCAKRLNRDSNIDAKDMKPSIDVIWNRLKKHQGQEFKTKTGKPFSYEISGTIFRTNRTKYNITRSDFAKALKWGPIESPGDINNLVRGPSYVWAVLHDRRIISTD